MAVYGPRYANGTAASEAVTELDLGGVPGTLVGCSQRYCEHLGAYYSSYYRQLDSNESGSGVDFVVVRAAPVLVAGGVPRQTVTNYPIEMLRAVAAGRAYSCPLDPNTRIPFLVAQDCGSALVALGMPRTGTVSGVYNVRSFSASALEFADLARRAFPQANISFESDPRLQAIVDLWPKDLDITSAGATFGFEPWFDIGRAFEDHLLPALRS